MSAYSMHYRNSHLCASHHLHTVAASCFVPLYLRSCLLCALARNFLSHSLCLVPAPRMRSLCVLVRDFSRSFAVPCTHSLCLALAFALTLLASSFSLDRSCALVRDFKTTGSLRPLNSSLSLALAPVLHCSRRYVSRFLFCRSIALVCCACARSTFPRSVHYACSLRSTTSL